MKKGYPPVKRIVFITGLLLFLLGINACFLPGFISGIVKDALTDTPIENAAVTLSKNGRVLDQTTTDASGSYLLQTESGSGYAVTVEMAGYITATYRDIQVTDNQTTFLETILQLAESYSGSGTVSGKITDAFTGEGVAAATIQLRSGINTTSGEIVASTTSLADGSFSITCNGGNYTGEISKSGYITEYLTLICIGGQTRENQNGSLTPVIETGQTRIILTWGEQPEDLDAHLTGPLATGERFHLYYWYSEDGDGSPWPDHVKLDIDDTDSFGPETTTIYNQRVGTYRFSVHDYSNSELAVSTALASSGARVKVYRGSTLVYTFNVPNQAGTLWTVFEMTGTTIIPVNTMSYQTDSSVITRGRPSRKNDGALIAALPGKP